MTSYSCWNHHPQKARKALSSEPTTKIKKKSQHSPPILMTPGVSECKIPKLLEKQKPEKYDEFTER